MKENTHSWVHVLGASAVDPITGNVATSGYEIYACTKCKFEKTEWYTANNSVDITYHIEGKTTELIPCQDVNLYKLLL